MRVGWPERHLPTEASAIEHAWNLRIDRGEMAFASEYQNDPMPESREGSTSIDPDEVLARCVSVPRGTVPLEATVLTAGVDVQGACLYWLVAAWTDEGSGWIVDYGQTPEQPHGRLALAEVSRSLESTMPGVGEEARIGAALAATFESLCARDWPVEGGATMRVERLFADSSWGDHTETVRSAAKSSRMPVMPARGVGITAKSTHGITETRRMPGDRRGLNWIAANPLRRGSTVREVRHDANFWKSWIAARLRTAIGEPGAMVICGDKPSDMRRHEQLAEQLAAEECVMVEARGRRVGEWTQRRPGLDNHLLDCLVMASVAANMQGVVVSEIAAATASQSRKRVSLREVQARRMR
ncbi:MAG: terminase gpA endonuclease subunit [Phycisphaerales bacterium]